MSLALAGMGWVTPLGTDLEEVWARLLAGERAAATPLTNPETGRRHSYAAIPPQLVAHLGRQPRLRRASPISYYAVAAGLAALAQAGLTPSPELAARMAVIFAVSSGSVVYTRRFFEGVVKQGPAAASPMLFPETVYNAPASHLAAQLGIDGASYTLVGDSSVSLSAVKLAEQMLLTGDIDYALVVGAEEIDWVLCEAYRDWRFAGGDGQSLAYARRPIGALLAEGAGALLLTRTGEGTTTGLEIASVHDGISYTARDEIGPAVQKVAQGLLASGLQTSSAAGDSPDCIIGSANGSWTDQAEAAALTGALANIPHYVPKLALGEALGAGALWQVIAGALALQKSELPAVGVAGEFAPAGLARRESALHPWQTALVLATGLNQQASGLLLQMKADL